MAEVRVSVNRGLSRWQKMPGVWQKKPIIWQKRPVYKEKKAYLYGTRGLLIPSLSTRIQSTFCNVLFSFTTVLCETLDCDLRGLR